MKWIALVALALLAGCQPRIRDTFTVDVADGATTSAVVSVCGVDTPMKRSGSQFEASYPIDCEGEGDVLVRFADGALTKCHLGYITPDAGQDWRFAVRDRSCRDTGYPQQG